MKFLTILAISMVVLLASSAVAAKPKRNKAKAKDATVEAAASEPVAAQQQPPPRPKINWGKCPQLEPTEKDIEAKSKILHQCLEQHPPPQTKEITAEQIVQHQQSVTECALKVENWFDKKGKYKFEKAEKEIKNKNLSKDMEKALLESHKQCQQISHDRAQAAKKMSMVEQVQIYQGCMDAHITQNCEIQITAA